MGNREEGLRRGAGGAGGQHGDEGGGAGMRGKEVQEGGWFTVLPRFFQGK